MIASSDWAWADACAHPVPRHPGPHADLREEGLRSESAVPGGVPFQGSVHARRWLRRLPRRRLILQERRADDAGTPNPVPTRDALSSAAASRNRATSCAAAALGFTQDEDGRQVQDGGGRSSPAGASRSISAGPSPMACSSCTRPGSEGPQWWADWPDPSRCRGRHPRPLQGQPRPARRSSSTSAPPKSGRLKLTPEWVGTDAKTDIPLRNVRRYYIASTPHGGGAGGFDSGYPARPPQSGPPARATTTAPARCPPIRCRRQTVNASRCTSATG